MTRGLSSALTDLKLFIRRHFWLRYATVASHRLLICARESVMGVTDPAVDNADRVFGYYKTFSGRQKFHGVAIEIGAGSSNHMAELMLSAGCEHVDLLDRFFNAPDGNLKITRHVAAAEEFFCVPERYDFIFSAAVLEHLYDPLLALQKMAAALKRGGAMIHIVDLRDHGLFSPLNDLSFLRLPDWMYWPFCVRGGPNRVRMSDYRRCLETLALPFSIYVTQLAGSDRQFLDAPCTLDSLEQAESAKHARAIRPRLAARFSGCDDADLMVSGIAIVATKPTETAPQRTGS